jgi:putative peptide zinc metalloprotease protein
VLVVGQSHVVVPQNLSEAVNYGCVDCLTAAVAHQLVLTLNGPLSADSMAQLNRLWAQITAFSKDLQGLSLSEVQARLDAFEQQVKDLVKADPAASPAGASSSGSTSAPGTASTPAPTATAGPQAGDATSAPDAPGGTDATTAPTAEPGATTAPAPPAADTTATPTPVPTP